MSDFVHPENVRDRLPHLVQRIKTREFPREGEAGVDAYFSMDYMGSSEFEWGSLPTSLKILREQLKAGKIGAPVEIKGTREGQPVSCWYVGIPEYLETVTYFFQMHMGRQDGWLSFNLQEQTNLWRAYGPEFTDRMERKTRKGKTGKPRPIPNYDFKLLGWWCVDQGYFTNGSRPYGTWAIFKTRELADKWLAGLKSK